MKSIIEIALCIGLRPQLKEFRMKSFTDDRWLSLDIYREP